MVLSFVHGLLENPQPAPAQLSTPKTEGGSEKERIKREMERGTRAGSYLVEWKGWPAKGGLEDFRGLRLPLILQPAEVFLAPAISIILWL